MEAKTRRRRLISQRMRAAISRLLIFTITTVSVSSPSWAEPPKQAATTQRSTNGSKRMIEQEEAKIPQTPSAPPALAPQPPQEIFRCERTFIHKGKVLTCDSLVRRDAERLRPILQGTPEAISELNTYQRNRRVVRNAAFVSTFGLVLAVAGFLISQQYLEEKGKLSSTGKTIRDISLYGGATLSIGSAVYGISLLKTNEAHLGNAVQYYNSANPDTPIELQFTTGITF